MDCSKSVSKVSCLVTPRLFSGVNAAFPRGSQVAYVLPAPRILCTCFVRYELKSLSQRMSTLLSSTLLDSKATMKEQ